MRTRRRRTAVNMSTAEAAAALTFWETSPLIWETLPLPEPPEKGNCTSEVLVIQYRIQVVVTVLVVSKVLLFDLF